MVVEENGGCMDSHLQKYKVSFVFTEGGGSEIFLHGFLSDHSLFFFSVGDVVRWNVSLAEMVKRRRRRRRNDGWPQRTHTQTQSQGCYRVWKEAEQVSGWGREGGRKEGKDRDKDWREDTPRRTYCLRGVGDEEDGSEGLKEGRKNRSFACLQNIKTTVYCVLQ